MIKINFNLRPDLLIVRTAPISPATVILLPEFFVQLRCAIGNAGKIVNKRRNQYVDIGRKQSTKPY